MGASVEELPDGMIIHGPSKLKGAKVNSFGDHRVAMALSVAGLVAEGTTMIDEATSVEISYPDFYQCLHGLLK
ncbi:MAG: 3-phosphoshikimate 1-carboxyvinyltransferase, partial [Nitrospirae bacterium]